MVEGFSAATAAWFDGAFSAPTAAQAGAWSAIGRGDNTLVVAPTGSGKTLAAFLWSLDRLATTPPPEDPKHRCRVLYVSPLKALAVDVERNLRAPLTGIRQAARRLGLDEPDVRVGIRSGDTPADERRRLVAHPPDILITTPESLFLMLTSQAREALRGVETVIVDEVHAVAATKRGAHLALSLERLDELLPRPAQRIGLSATVRPVEEVAAFLGGARPATVVQPPSHKDFDLRVVVPLEDMSEPAGEERSIWPHVEDHVLDLIESHRSTIVFANSRRLAERLCGRLNELAYERSMGEPLPENLAPADMMAMAGALKGAPREVARAHHGSVSKEERAGIEESLKAGRLPAVVATSSLELGIDMGAVDLVVQVESPPSVAGGLQRIGRAGHQVGAVSKGVIFPKYRGDLVQTAVVAERMRGGRIEELRYPRNPLDVLAQQIVAMVAMDEWTVDDLERTVRRAAPYATLPRSALEATLDMLAGRYPSEEFGELRPRLVWDRITGTLRARPGAQRLAVTSGGTIPDRGLFGVFLVGEKASRVGELDEEMVYESRIGDVFVLGASSWRIEDITPDRVLVSPAPGQPGKLPFWHGDTPGRPAELGRALGAFTRELAALPPEQAKARVQQSGLDDWAAGNLVAYLAEQREATRHVPDDRTLVVERFRDELGDWRLVVHSPYGALVHGPWALAIAARLRERYGMDAQAMHADDGIVLRVPDTDEPPPADLAVFDPDEIERLVVDELGSSPLFAARFRECAARSLLLPRRRPDRRMPLWQQRQRAAQLLSVASKYATFPITLETMRECLQDVFDVPGLVQLMRDLAGRKTRLVEVETPTASPFARSLLFRYIGAFMYEGDAPLAERRAQALALDSALLAELLGQSDLRELLDPEVIAEAARELQRLTPDRQATDLEGVADLLRLLGPLTTPEVLARTADPRTPQPPPDPDQGTPIPPDTPQPSTPPHPSWATPERPSAAPPGPDATQPRNQPPTERPETDGDQPAPPSTPVPALPQAARQRDTADPRTGPVLHWLAELEATRRAIRIRIGGTEHWAAIEDAGRLRDALGVPLPMGVPEAFLEPVDDPLGDLLSRYARTHTPFPATEPAHRFALGTAVVTETLRRLSATGRVVEGEFLPFPTFAPEPTDPRRTSDTEPQDTTNPDDSPLTSEIPANDHPIDEPDHAESPSPASTHPPTTATPARGDLISPSDVAQPTSTTSTGDPATADPAQDDPSGTTDQARYSATTQAGDSAATRRAENNPIGAAGRARPFGSAGEGRAVSVAGGLWSEWCDAGVLRMLRRRSLARLRAEVEPSPPEALARFLPAWHGVGTGRLRGMDALVQAIDQLQGAAVPASALESLILPARVPDYSPALLDELTSAGEVVWAGQGSLPGGDGWVSLYLADTAPLLLADPTDITLTPLHEKILDLLADGGALFFRTLSDRINSPNAVRSPYARRTQATPGSSRPSGGQDPASQRLIPPAGEKPGQSGGPLQPDKPFGSDRPGHSDRSAQADTPAQLDRSGRLDRSSQADGTAGAGEVSRVADQELVTALWDLVWAGHLTNDTLAPLRATLGSGRPAHRPRTARRGRPVMPSRTGPPTVAGRWWLVPEREDDRTRRTHALGETLLERYGIVLRGAVAAEHAPGGFAAVYPVLKAFEESGRCRRGYFVEGLGAAQFALPGAVDRLRSFRDVAPRPTDPPTLPDWQNDQTARPKQNAVVLAAADPANAYGAALPWPTREDEAASGHKPGRKAGALVVLVDGSLVLYVERGGRTLLSWTDDPDRLQPAVDALALAVREGALGKLTVERADGESIVNSPLGDALEAAGFHPTPRGLRLRS